MKRVQLPVLTDNMITTSGNSMNWETDFCNCEWPSGRPSSSCYSTSLDDFPKCNYCEKYLKCELCNNAAFVYRGYITCKEHEYIAEANTESRGW